MLKYRALLIAVSGLVTLLRPLIGPASGHPFHSGVKPKEVFAGTLQDPEEIRQTLRQFHGHLGPYATLGYRIGAHAVERLACPKYFGVSVVVVGRTEVPFGCFVDGLQVGTGCTQGKGNLTKIAHTPGEGDAVFVVTIRSQTGKCLEVSVLPTVPTMFSEWLQSDASADELFDRLLNTPVEELWTEELIPEAPLAEYLHVVDKPVSLPVVAEGKNGTVRVPACSDRFTVVSFVLPPGYMSAPVSGGLAGLEAPTVVLKGKLDLIAMDEQGKETRTTLPTGAVFVWPQQTWRAVGYQNPYQEPCELVTVYVPAFPGVRTPEEAGRWLEAGCPSEGLSAPR